MGTFGTKTRTQIKKQARKHWGMWRLVLGAGIAFNTVFHQMTPDEIREANAAFDLYLEAKKKK